MAEDPTVDLTGLRDWSQHEAGLGTLAVTLHSALEVSKILQVLGFVVSHNGWAGLARHHLLPRDHDRDMI